MKHPDYPGVSSYVVKGKAYYKFRRTGLTPATIPGQPHTPEFDAFYQSLVEAQVPPRKGQLVRLPGTALPESWRAAYIELRKTAAWKRLDGTTQTRNSRHIEHFLSYGNGKDNLGDCKAIDTRRKHIKAYLETLMETPHAAHQALKAIRKLVMTAMDEEWIDTDPTWKLKFNPQRDGWPAWTAEMMDNYERYWPIGTPQRTAYSLGLWLGNRVSDVARLRWDQLKTKSVVVDGEPVTVEGFDFIQHKGRKEYAKQVFLPMTPFLAAALAPLSRDTERVLVSRLGRTFSDNALATAMIKWAGMAGVPSGYSMHGLRKALGVKLAEADATTREIMDVLGHTNIEHAALYTKEADNVRLAVKGMRKVAALEAARRKPNLRVVK